MPGARRSGGRRWCRRRAASNPDGPRVPRVRCAGPFACVADGAGRGDGWRSAEPLGHSAASLHPGARCMARAMAAASLYGVSRIRALVVWPAAHPRLHCRARAPAASSLYGVSRIRALVVWLAAHPGPRCMEIHATRTRTPPMPIQRGRGCNEPPGLAAREGDRPVRPWPKRALQRDPCRDGLWHGPEGIQGAETHARMICGMSLAYRKQPGLRSRCGGAVHMRALARNRKKWGGRTHAEAGLGMGSEGYGGDRGEANPCRKALWHGPRWRIPCHKPLRHRSERAARTGMIPSTG